MATNQLIHNPHDHAPKGRILINTYIYLILNDVGHGETIWMNIVCVPSLV